MASKKPTSTTTAHLLAELRASREGPQRDERPRFLLCFEDAKSAPNYFEALRANRRLSQQMFIIDRDSSASDPKGVVDRAVTRAEDLHDKGEFEDDDQVWCVIDVDAHTTMNDAIQRARSNKIRLAISNPCFEYWLLVHFENSATPYANCDAVISALKKYISDYSKGKTEFNDIIKQADETAKRARTLHQSKAEPDPVKCCPCTTIYKLIEAMPAAK